MTSMKVIDTIDASSMRPSIHKYRVKKTRVWIEGDQKAIGIDWMD